MIPRWKKRVSDWRFLLICRLPVWAMPGGWRRMLALLAGDWQLVTVLDGRVWLGYCTGCVVSRGFFLFFYVIMSRELLHGCIIMRGCMNHAYVFEYETDQLKIWHGMICIYIDVLVWFCRWSESNIYVFPTFQEPSSTPKTEPSCGRPELHWA